MMRIMSLSIDGREQFFQFIDDWFVLGHGSRLLGSTPVGWVDSRQETFARMSLQPRGRHGLKDLDFCDRRHGHPGGAESTGKSHQVSALQKRGFGGGDEIGDCTRVG